MNPHSPPRKSTELVSAFLIFLATVAYIWLAAARAPWLVVVPAGLVVLHWYRRRETVDSLGLRWKDFVRSFRSWRVVWIACIVVFIAFGWTKVAHAEMIGRGAVYFCWCAIQQLIYQSVTYRPIRDAMKSPWMAAPIAGIAFAAVHAPNPVLMAGTLAWGVLSSLLFERCRSIWGLAALQVMLSSMLLWATPYSLNRGFRIGPFY